VDNKNGYLNKYDITGSLEEFPYNSESDIFDSDKVITSLNKQIIK
jgi:hypothetical protein